MYEKPFKFTALRSANNLNIIHKLFGKHKRFLKGYIAIPVSVVREREREELAITARKGLVCLINAVEVRVTGRNLISNL